jgi:hypothetical protein
MRQNTQNPNPNGSETAKALWRAIRRPDMKPIKSKHRNKITKTIMAINNWKTAGEDDRASASIF